MRPRSYENANIRVTYEPDVCEHAAECVKGLPGVFNADARPWIQMDNAAPSEVAEQVRRCPSGALQYELLGPA